MELQVAQRLLVKLLQQQTLPQVVLFYGREGMPADSLLHWLQLQLFCTRGGACHQCAACQSVAQGKHNNVLHCDAEQESFGVDEVRRVQNFLPLLGESRVAIVRAAHLISRAAANKLLKVLEEPPPAAYIFLTTNRYGQLLPTITSRCFHFLLAEQDKPPSSSFTKQFEQLLAASSYTERLAGLKKLRENKCSLREFVDFYEQHLNHSYRAALGKTPPSRYRVVQLRARVHAIKRIVQQQVSLNMQLGIETLLPIEE